MWLVVGLGNPGPSYAANRHNVGFLIAETLAGRARITLRRHRRVFAMVGEGRLGVGEQAPQVVISKPMSYMNLVGGPVAALVRFYKVEPAHLIVVHDELDLPYGQVRAKLDGGEGGHNGLRSVSAALSSREYLRVRFGIGRPPGSQDPADYVLSDFSKVQQKDIDYLVDRSTDMVEALILHGLAWTQNTYHTTIAP